MLKRVQHDDIQPVQHDMGKISLAWQKGIATVEQDENCHLEFSSER